MSTLTALIARYGKFITALVGVVLLVVGDHYGLTSTAYTTIVSVATALGVYGVPNGPPKPAG